MAIGVNTQYVYVSCSISIKWYTLTHSNQHSSNNNHHLFIEYIRMSIHRFLFTSFFFLSSSSSCFSHLMMLLFFCRIVISDIDNISEIEIWQYHQEYSLHLYGKWKTKIANLVIRELPNVGSRILHWALTHLSFIWQFNKHGERSNQYWKVKDKFHVG